MEPSKQFYIELQLIESTCQAQVVTLIISWKFSNESDGRFIMRNIGVEDVMKVKMLTKSVASKLGIAEISFTVS